MTTDHRARDPYSQLADTEDCGLRILRRAVDAAPNGILITDNTRPDNPIVYANPAFERMTGYTAGEILGRNCRFLQGDDRDQPGIAELRAAFTAGGTATVLLRNYCKDGSLFWNRLHISPVRDDQGALTHYVGIQEDVTREREEEAARRQLLEIVETTPDLVVITAPDGTILYRNRSGLAAMGLSGTAPEPGETLEDLLAPWARQRLREEGLATAVREGFWQGPGALLDSGREIPVSLVLLAHYDGYGEVERLSAVMRAGDSAAEPPSAASSQAMYREIVEAAREGFDRMRREDTGPGFHRLPVDSSGDIAFLDPERVRFFQAEGNYALAFTERDHHLANLSLADLERRLESRGFLRSHRSYLVNLDHVTTLKTLDGQTYLVMDTEQGDRVPVSRRNLDTVRTALGLA
ncbi:PAS domain-containing protein [Thiohalorhabdus methylotrophus]|uniref:PAS domain-containing protein n=1 Tax=Thiohalorhabdus methylotrophus TaxID=3242694 RepID=A0ABV4TSE4_9GAMM